MRRNRCFNTLLVLIPATAFVFAFLLLARTHNGIASGARAANLTWTVTSNADSGPGTLRQALLDASGGDTVLFSPTAFPPSSPATITLASPLPTITQHNLTVDASNAGVVIDGSGLGDETPTGLDIVANGVTIRGLQIVNFPHNGIGLSGQYNTIGGNRAMGAGPLGQGNLISGNGESGIILIESETLSNTIQGNFIGVNASGTAAWGNTRDGIHINSAHHNLILDNVIGGNNNSGIQGCCNTNSSYNVIRQNKIGVGADGQTPIPNGQSGIWFHDGASHNTVGPENVIAYNPIGIQVHTAPSIGNTITHNSIYSNEFGIDLADGGNTGLAAPYVMSFDLSEGVIWGKACPGCVVEIFSDQGDQGAVYEGQAIADSTGFFYFDKSVAFLGPHLTTTTTDGAGNTSSFSPSTTGSGKEWIIQTGNYQPISHLNAQCSSELIDNHIGTFWGYVRNVEGWGNGCAPQGIKGFKMVKLSFNEVEDWPEIDWSQPEFDIQPEQDALVTSLAENGITVTYILNFWDKANHPNGWPVIPSRFTTEEEIQRYLEYVRFIVGHFKDRVRYFELWNEPDNTGSAIQHIMPDDYVELVRRVVPVIRDEYPEAKIVVGSVSYLRNPYAHDYLYYIVQSDIMPLVDVVAWHPMYGTSPDYEDEREYYYAYPGILRDIKETAIAHGFQGEFRGDEIGWCSPDISDCGAALHMHTNITAAKYHTRGMVMHLGMGVTVHFGGMSGSRRETTTVVSNLATVLAGAGAESFPIQVQTTLTNVVSYTFALPGNAHLIAIWNDAPAVEDDPGINTTVILPGYAGQVATGIDPLHSLVQSLITHDDGQSLVIQNLRVKDYVLLIRVAPIQKVYLPVVSK